MPAFIPALPLTFRSIPPKRARPMRFMVRAKLEAVLFDCDGVLADTERDAHRVAFNLAFAERGLSDEWTEAQYGELLSVGGGKERMTAYWNAEPSWPSVATDPDSQQQLVRELHQRKTALFMELVDAGKVPLRPGVARLVRQLREENVRIAVCSTSNEKAVRRIVEMLGDDADGIQVFAGDIVDKKKPAPDVYLLAKNDMALGNDVVVVEDSFIGVCSARAAGMPVVVTKSTYTKDEDFAQAQLVVESLDEPHVGLAELEAVLSARGGRGLGRVRRARRRYGSSYL